MVSIHGFDSCRELRFFSFIPRSSRVDQFTFHISLPGLNLPSLFIYQLILVV